MEIPDYKSQAMAYCEAKGLDPHEMITHNFPKNVVIHGQPKRTELPHGGIQTRNFETEGMESPRWELIAEQLLDLDQRLKILGRPKTQETE